MFLALKNGNFASIFSPFYANGWSQRINLDGVVTYSGGRKNPTTNTYTQLYRNGVVEAVESEIFSVRTATEKKVLPMSFLERESMNYTAKMLKFLSEMGFQPPFYIFISLIGVEGFHVSKPERNPFLETELITQKDLLLPEVIIENMSDDLGGKFRPIFDMIWNASGVSKSLNFDDNDNFVDR